MLIIMQYMPLACVRDGRTPAYTYRTRYQFECDAINAKVFLRAIAWYCYRKSFVHLSVCLSVRDADVPWPYKLG